MNSLLRLRQLPVIQRTVWNHYNKTSRVISTSKKNSDSAAAAPIECQEEKNWVSYGFDYKDQKADTDAHHASFFFSVTLCLVFGGFAWAYAPDTLGRDWAQREAFLELSRREKAGLPPVDPNYIPKNCMSLPREKDICDVEIII